ncbi:CotO family spore coat protein [Pseudalkalibacillus caeni]|nr:CotO family spore coat protein [Pseudalkalibacillus caeni]
MDNLNRKRRRRRKENTDPVMYIAQPKLSPIQFERQTVASSKTTTKERNSDLPVKDAENIEDKENVKTETKTVSYQEMDNEERINYILNMPFPVKVEIQTEEKTHKGIITGKEEGQIKVRTIARPYRVSLHLDEILDVRMISL